MANLYWRKNGKILAAKEVPFKTEDELERYLLDNKRGILSDIAILNRQIRARSISGIEIPDMIGVDNEGAIVIIENKNVPVDEKIFAQILNYAVWAESNPDSIKSLWLESDQETTVEPDWNNLKIRMMIVAPEIKPHLARIISRIGYQIDLLEIKKFDIDSDEFIILNKIESNSVSAKPVHARKDYSMVFYAKSHNKESVMKYKQVIDKVERFIKKNKWELETKFNQNYVGFKYGFPLVLGIQWLGTKSFGFFFKLPKAMMKNIKVPGLEFKGYSDRWNQVEYKIDSIDFKIEKLTPVFLASYKYVKGS